MTQFHCQKAAHSYNGQQEMARNKGDPQSATDRYGGAGNGRKPAVAGIECDISMEQM